MCRGDDNLDPLVDLLRVVERFAVEPAVEQSPYELGERLIRLRHGIDLLELRFAREAAAFCGHR